MDYTGDLNAAFELIADLPEGVTFLCYAYHDEQKCSITDALMQFQVHVIGVSALSICKVWWQWMDAREEV